MILGSIIRENLWFPVGVVFSIGVCMQTYNQFEFSTIVGELKGLLQITGIEIRWYDGIFLHATFSDPVFVWIFVWIFRF